jgi:hypothetical protein
MKQLVEIIQSGINSKEFDFKIGANEAAELLFEATIAYHHPGFIRDNIDLDRSSRLKKLLEVLINGLK